MSPNHPYRSLPDYQFWSRAVTWAPPGGLDPVVATGFRVGVDDRVVTMGSCFAQHLSRHLSRSGLTYLVTEPGPHDIDADEARRRNFGVFSARYGNVYTVAQAVQLFRRAYDDFRPVEGAWEHNGVLVDPFRPQVEPDGFADAAALESDRVAHLAATRSVFEQSEVLVFTLGLTEGWRSREDDAVYPTAPGVAGGSYDPARYEFVNFSVDQVRQGLFEFCELARSVNPGIRILLTVSPVPLIATYEPRHVLVSTTYSKAVLRVAADEATRRFDFVDYFPSYEIVASATSIRNYYAEDLREVDELGVAHVMRCFTRHYVDGKDWSIAPTAPTATPRSTDDVVCDEEAIAAAVDAALPDAEDDFGADRLAWGPAANGPEVRGPVRAPTNETTNLASPSPQPNGRRRLRVRRRS